MFVAWIKSLFGSSKPAISLEEAAALFYGVPRSEVITDLDGSAEVDDIELKFSLRQGKVLAVERSTPDEVVFVAELKGELFRIRHSNDYARIEYA